ncbi:copper resistance system multicopper oxidase [Phenylobacterium sp.]|uniref:copper resistance system multicopper oxidase n=1 Tax=Phenylobacterium sp. TaxID=1871053 RepID=UPI002733A62C|nr:copper resistance system multicopper oxidase [Phenylobacterium sp.]MDP3659626.1 copper resistance system multicopper oxidase [Phenylobacterium sp.]
MFRLIRPRLLLAAIALFTAAEAQAAEYDLVLAPATVTTAGRPGPAITVNGQIPGPTLHFREGETATVRVTNNLKDTSSVHWHGILLDSKEDGVPGFNGFVGIKPGQTYTYSFPLRQAGTYWYHAHSATQEQAGHYGAIVVDPPNGPVVKTDRDYVLVFSESSAEDPERILGNLKVDPSYYNTGRRTVGDFFRDAGKFGFQAAWRDRANWGRMRMNPTDISDVSGYVLLANGKPAEANETFLFTPGQSVKLRLVNSSAMTFLDVRIPGLKMTVVAADGRDVVPVTVDELRISVAETYDVVVEPKADQAFTIFAESIDRRGYARATLATRAGDSGPIPAMRPRAILTMAEMGTMGGMAGMDMSGGHDHGAPAAAPVPGAAPAPEHHHHGAPSAQDKAADSSAAAQSGGDMAGMDMSGGGHAHHQAASPSAGEMDMTPEEHAAMMGDAALPKIDYGMGKPTAGHGMSELSPEGTLDGSGRVFGWANGAPAGSRVLSYNDLRALTPNADSRPPDREIVVRLGGDMERFVWTLNGKTFGEDQPIRLRYGERVRMTFINETMMAHPMHLHGMFMQLENGQPADLLPDKHVVTVAPGRTASVLITANELGEWAFHCHLLYHMEAGMMQQVVVAREDGSMGPSAAPPAAHDHHDHAGHGGAQ